MPVHLGAQAWTNTTLSASQRASLLLAQMTFSEQAAMVYGTAGPAGSNYVGNIANNTRLGIPWIFLQDGPAGVADGADNVTAFPAPIALAASWDVSLARQYGVMLGSEERGKGVGVVLGPMMNMARVYEDGRAFEGYGEDPYLSGAMAAAEIPGIQSQGVIATAKHFVCNDQETDRTTISADVDPRTLAEIYEAPFRASVRAGVGAIMASYNLVNNVHACQLPALNTDLKKAYGFNGWIMSDWGASFDTVDGMNNGLDMDMYTGQFTASDITAAIQAGSVPASELPGMVQRILTSMFQFGLFDNPSTGNLNANVTGTAHAQFARNEAAAGTVLLQNNGGLLPLGSSVQSIAVIGSAASTSPISTGAGSAGVNLPYNITPLAGITSRATNVTVSYAQGDGASTAAAVSLAQSNQVVIICVGQQTSEGSDRANLSLPNNEDALISAVAAVNTNTIVVVYESSATLMPWANQVAAILMAWYPGQENGNALAQILFGDVNPSGKLPVSIPPSASQVPTSTTAQWPGINGQATYSEGLEIGYRWYDANNVAPLFAFGYGLSYTTFGYSNLTVSTVSPSGQVQISFDLTNTGTLTGAEVPQLYLGFPAAAGEPPKLLKDFQKISLSPGQTQHVTFNLDWEDLANWDATARGWIVTPGTFQVMVGASSRDIRLTGAFTVASVPSSDLANAALHQPVIVSSVLSTNTSGAAAVDGDTTSAWTSLASDPQWIEVDLGLIKDLSRVRLHWNTNYASSYTIQISPDETNWTAVFTTNNDTGGTEDILVSGRGRYVQINGMQQGVPGAGYSLSELEVYSQPQEPFGGTVPTMSGGTNIIQAENYDTGGESVAYYNTTIGNPGGLYRTNADVGIEPTSDTGGGYDVGWLNSGEWLEYTVNLPYSTANYTISARVAAPAAGGQLRVRVNGAVVGTINIPNTGGWQTWQTVTLPTVSLTGGIGSQTLRLEVITNGFNINWIGLSTPLPTVPAAPTGLTAGAGNGSVYLSWNASTWATAYNVKRSLVSGGPYTTIASPTANSYLDPGVSDCSSYYYVVSATNSLGESPNSSESAVTLGAFELAVNSGGSPANQFIADTYYSGGTAASTTAAINTSNVTNPAPQAVYQTERYGNFTYTFPNLTPGMNYLVRLHFAEIYWTATNDRIFNVFINGNEVLTNFDVFAVSGGEDIANIQQFMVAPNATNAIVIQYVTIKDNAKSSGIEILLPPPAAPANLTATAGNSQVALTWNASSGATSYNVERSLVSGGPYTLLSGGLTSTNYTDSAVTNGTTYYYVVLAVNNGCESTNSTQVSATPNPPIVPALYGASITNGQFGFWISGNTGTNYTIMASTNLTSWNPIFTTNPPLLPFFWADTNSSAYPVRFYRTVLGP